MSYKLACAVDICTDKELDIYDGVTTYMNDEGNHECVVFVQSVVTGLPSTKYWKAGVHILGSELGPKPTIIPKGTAIATFDDAGNYPTDAKGKHAAIYQSHTNEYIEVLDQWKWTEKEREGKKIVSGGKVVKRRIKFNVKNGERRSNDGKTFYVIELKTVD